MKDFSLQVGMARGAEGLGTRFLWIKIQDSSVLPSFHISNSNIQNVMQIHSTTLCYLCCKIILLVILVENLIKYLPIADSSLSLS